MCEKLRYCARKIDPCIESIVDKLIVEGLDPILSCCGHSKYNPSIIIRNKDNSVYEYFSKITLKSYNPDFDKRHNHYYKKDRNGYYFINDIVNKDLPHVVSVCDYQSLSRWNSLQ